MLTWLMTHDWMCHIRNHWTISVQGVVIIIFVLQGRKVELWRATNGRGTIVRWRGDWRIRSGCQGSPVRLRLRGAVFPFETSVMSHQFESKSTTCFFFNFEIMEGAQNRAWFQSHFSGKCWKASASSQQWEWCDSALLELNLTSLFCAWAIFQTFWLWSGLTVPS